MLRSLILIAAGAALAHGGAASAQQKGAPQAIKRADVASKLDSSFAAADTNHDGTLSLSEIQTIQNKELEQATAQLRARLKAAFDQLDTNKDGQLSFAEFAASAGTVKSNETPAQVLQKLDANHDGKVTAAEFKGPRLAAFDRVDTNHDGIVTPEELRKAGGAK